MIESDDDDELCKQKKNFLFLNCKINCWIKF